MAIIAGVLELWSVGELERPHSVSAIHHSNTPLLHIGINSLLLITLDVSINEDASTPKKGAPHLIKLP